MNTEERRRAIQSAIVQMDKQFGKGAVLLLGSRNALPVTTISTGSLSIDAALGVGGLAEGRVERRHLADQHVHRPGVGDDVVQAER